MRMIATLATVAALATVGACTELRDFGQDRPAVDPLVACTSYEAVLGTINDVLASGEVSDEKVVSIGERVQDVNLVILGTPPDRTNGLCTGPTLPESNSEAAARILGGLSNLVTIQQEVLP